jgi:hypothetical protein
MGGKALKNTITERKTTSEFERISGEICQILNKNLEKNSINIVYPFKSKNDYINDIEDFFPEAELISMIDKLSKKDNENSFLASKFNGKKIMKVFPELQDKKLGKIMTEFKKSQYDYNKYILDHTIDEILNDFSNFYKIYYFSNHIK